MAPLMTYINGAKAGMCAPAQQRQQEATTPVKVPSVAEADKPHITEFEHAMFYVSHPSSSSSK
jgi:hypothetical protein